MTDPNLVLTLGKVIVAAAWADGEVSREEINSLKDLTFQLRDLTARQWAELEMYIETPVGDAERARLIDDLRRMVSSADDRALALKTIDDLINADGVVTPAEREVAEEVKAAIGGSGGPNGLFRFVDQLLNRRSTAISNAPNREEHFEDYIKNKVFYKLQQRLQQDDASLDIPEADLRKLCLAGGMMAQVARANPEITDSEFESIVEALQQGWAISRAEATFVAEVAISDAATSFDRLRLSREFLKVCKPGEAREFLEILFRVAAADGNVADHEAEHIRSIARELLLSNKEFAAARRRAIAAIQQ
jgi:uncharacterized tellurite resistance protein B-like protein